MIGGESGSGDSLHTVLVHLPATDGSGVWTSHQYEVVRVPRMGEHVVLSGDLYSVELVIHPLHGHEGPHPPPSYTAELCCVPVSKIAVLNQLMEKL